MKAHLPETDPIATRRAALQIVSTVLDKKQPLDQTLEQSHAFNSLPEPRDRAFTRMIATTTLRRLGQIDDLIRKASSNPEKEISPPLLKHIIRIGVTQLVFMEVPDYAAVNTSVDLTDENNLSKTKGFANAVLRKIAREGRDWTARQDIPRLNTPEWMLQKWVEDYGLKTAIEIGQGNMEEPPLDLTVKSSEDIAYWQSHLQAELLPTGSLRVPKSGRIEEIAGYESGAWWVQDAVAALPAKLFGNIEGKVIADLCAAPGGKTAQLASQGAHVIALDRSARRLVRFRENIERLGLQDNVTTEAGDASVWKPKEGLDAILLDAPCTASGTLRKSPDVAWIKDKNDLRSLADLQERLLDNAATMLNERGILIYCTCSLFKDEGEHQIEAFLERHNDFSRAPITPPEIGGFSDAVTSQGDVRIFPYHMASLGGMDGFYISRLVKR